MLNVREEVKQKYLSDEYRGNFQFTIGTDSYDSTNIKSGTIELIESLYSGESLDFSAVEKGSLRFTLGNIDQSISDLLNKKIIFNQLIEYTTDESSTLPSNISVVGNKLVMYSPITTNLSVTDTILEFSEAGEQTSYDVNVNGQRVELTQHQNTEVVPLGAYTVVKSERASDYFVDVTAYDNLLLFDKDVTSWWDSLTFPITIRDLLVSLCTYCGAVYSFPQSFTNSTFAVNKNAVFESITGTEILGYIQQICACFIKANRNGQIVMVNLPTGTWSSATPVVTYDVHKIVSNLVIADYDTLPITGVIARATPDDVGVYVGTTSNAYIIENNPLLYDITSAQSGILTNIFNKISNVLFTPVSGIVKGACFVECGDLIKVQSFKGATAIVPVTYRRLHSSGLMRDEIKVKGTEKQTIVKTIDSSVRALHQRTHTLVNDVEQLYSEISGIDYPETITPYYFLSTSRERVEDIGLLPDDDLFPDDLLYPVEPWGGDWQTTIPDLIAGHWLWVKYKQEYRLGDVVWTTPELFDEVNKPFGDALVRNTKINQTVSEIELEASKLVGDDEIISKINVSPESVTIQSDKINMQGVTTFLHNEGYITEDDVGATGQTVIDGGRIQTGEMLADRVRGGTFIVGGYNNQAGVFEVHDEEDTKTGEINKTGLSVFSEGYAEYGGSTFATGVTYYELSIDTTGEVAIYTYTPTTDTTKDPNKTYYYRLMAAQVDLTSGMLKFYRPVDTYTEADYDEWYEEHNDPLYPNYAFKQTGYMVFNPVGNAKNVDGAGRIGVDIGAEGGFSFTALKTGIVEKYPLGGPFDASMYQSYQTIPEIGGIWVDDYQCGIGIPGYGVQSPDIDYSFLMSQYPIQLYGIIRYPFMESGIWSGADGVWTADGVQSYVTINFNKYTQSGELFPSVPHVLYSLGGTGGYFAADVGAITTSGFTLWIYCIKKTATPCHPVVRYLAYLSWT